jgi:trehalose-6-phosphate synthase
MAHRDPAKPRDLCVGEHKRERTGSARASQRALRMSLVERQERHAELPAQIVETTVHE